MSSSNGVSGNTAKSNSAIEDVIKEKRLQSWQIGPHSTLASTLTIYYTVSFIVSNSLFPAASAKSNANYCSIRYPVYEDNLVLSQSVRIDYINLFKNDSNCQYVRSIF